MTKASMPEVGDLRVVVVCGDVGAVIVEGALVCVFLIVGLGQDELADVAHALSTRDGQAVDVDVAVAVNKRDHGALHCHAGDREKVVLKTRNVEHVSQLEAVYATVDDARQRNVAFHGSHERFRAHAVDLERFG